MKAIPMTRDQANAYIEKHHRHHKRVTGHRFIVGAVQDAELVGVAVAGRPNAHAIDQYEHTEVLRLCSAGEANVCSFLYSRCSRIAREIGFRSIFTCILETEPGTSLKASGWVYCYTTTGGSWDRKTRPRKDKAPTGPKQVWAPEWCAAIVLTHNKLQAAKAAKRRVANATAKENK